MSAVQGSVARVRAALLAAGHPDTITEFPASTRTAADAAAAVGCTVAQIVKSIVFRPVGDQAGRAAVIITSGANRVDPAKAGAALGVKLARADADWVRAVTGFAIGGVAPIGHITPPLLLLDEDLLALDPIWAAAGTPSNVFRTTPAELRRITGAPVAEVRVAAVKASEVKPPEVNAAGKPA
jgi:prolyl-tRNA editing enzyme YbaK/EbsC (Cys-tRNA(Pro) deacylase)